jgi:hypothetical protein
MSLSPSLLLLSSSSVEAAAAAAAATAAMCTSGRGPRAGTWWRRADRVCDGGLGMDGWMDGCSGSSNPPGSCC